MPGMRRSTHEGATVVYRYGCPSWATLDDECLRQLRLAHDLRNELVAIERRYEEDNAALWRTIPDVAAAAAAVDQATAAVETVAAEVLAARVRNQSTAASPADRERLKQARQARAQAKAALKDVKARWRDEQRRLRAALDDKKKHAMGKDALYADFVVERGLSWATHNDVLAKHRISARRVGEQRRAGHAAEQRFRRWTGEGTLTVQVQRQPDGTRRDVWSLDEGQPSGQWTGKARRVGEQQTDRHRTLRLSLGRGRGHGPHTITLPVVVHRPLPPDADVSDVRITRRRAGTGFRLSVTFTCLLPPPEVLDGGVPVAVAIGWTGVGRGAVRVARISTPFGVPDPAPPHFGQPPYLGVMRPSAGSVDVVAPAQWRILLERVEDLRRHRDHLLDDCKAKVVDALADTAVAETVGATAAEVQRWRSQRRMALLVGRWPVDHPLLGALLAWRARDRHLWDYEYNLRDQVIARRRDVWRNVATWICSQASVVLVDCPPLAELRQKPSLDVEDDYQTRGARACAQFAAPGELRAAIVTAAERRGVRVIDVRSEADGA